RARGMSSRVPSGHGSRSPSRYGTLGWFAEAATSSRAGIRLLQQQRSLRLMPCSAQFVRHVTETAMHDAGDSLAAEPLRKRIQFLDQRTHDGTRVKQVDCNKMVGDQCPAEFQVVLNPIAEQATWKCPALASRGDDAASVGTTWGRELAREAQ